MKTHTNTSQLVTTPGDNAFSSAPQGSNRHPRRWVFAIVIGSLLAVSFLVWHFLIANNTRPLKLMIGSATDADVGSNVASTEQHPLSPAIEFARQVQQNIDANVRDYTATVIKQERIAGVLGPEEICFVKIRNHPFSAYMNFLAPEDLKGQEALYVAGANDDKLIGHAGSGPKALLGSVWLPPRGPLAMFGQRYPITELGIANLARRLIEVGEHDIHYGECYVWRNDHAKVGDRPCISVTVMHPQKRSGFLFHIARIFIDKELQVPVHYEAYDWPEKPGDPPPLLERYTYTRLKLNPGLTEADFDPKNPEYHFGLK